MALQNAIALSNRGSLNNYFWAVTFFLFPLLGIIVAISYLIINANKTFNKKDEWLKYPLSSAIAALGYCMTFYHGTETDLTRYFEQLHLLSVSSLVELLKNDSDYLYTRDLLFYFISKSGDFHILPYIVGFGVYYIAFYVLFDLIKKSEKQILCRDLTIIITIIVGIVYTPSVIENVRCVFAFMIITLATYRDIVQKKRNFLTLLLYVIPLGLHTAAISVLFVRIMLLFIKYIRNIGKYVIYFALVIPFMITFLHDNLAFGGIIGNFIRKAYFYLNWTEGGWADEVAKSISDKVVRIYGVFFILLSFFCVLLCNSNKKRSLFESPMILFIFCIGACTLGCLSIKTGAFWRYEAVFVFFSPVFLIHIFNSNKKKVRDIINILFYSSIMMAIFNTIRMFKNIDMISTFENYIYFNGFQLISGVIYG